MIQAALIIDCFTIDVETDYIIILVSPGSFGPVFFGRITLVLYFFLEVFALDSAALNAANEAR